MKLKTILSVCLTALVALTAGAQEKEYEYSFNTGQFNKLKVLNNINVVYSCNPDSTGNIVYRATKDYDGAFLIKNDDGTLKVQLMPEYSDEDLPTLYVYSDFLNYVENSSNKTVEINSLAPCAELKIRQVGNGRIVVNDIRATKVNVSLATGNGSLVVSGKADKVKYSLTGTGNIQGDLLEANDVTCQISGTGSIGCWATERLKVQGMGSTTIYYKGDPKIKKTSIGGKLEKIHTGE